MRVPNMSSTIAFYSRDWVENEFHVLVEVWTKVTILTKGSVNTMPSDPNLLEVIVRFNSLIVDTMRVQIDGDLFQYVIRHIAPFGFGQYHRLVLDKNNYLELFPAPDDLGPLTIHTRTDLVGFIKGDGYNLYADPNGGGTTPTLPDNVVFTYVNGIVTLITYDDGTTKSFNYNPDNTVSTIVWTRTDDIVTKTFTYNPDGTVARIDNVIS